MNAASELFTRGRSDKENTKQRKITSALASMNKNRKLENHGLKELSLRRPESTFSARAAGFNKVIVNKFFDALEEIVYQETITSSRIFNMDETSHTVVQRPEKVIAHRGQHQVGGITPCERGQNVTGAYTINSAGLLIPPMLIHTRKITKDSLAFGAPWGTIFRSQDEGWMTADVFTKWMFHFIRNHIASLVGAGFPRAASMEMAINSFRKTGSWPVDRHVFTDADFAAVSVIDHPFQESVAKEHSPVSLDVMMPEQMEHVDDTLQSKVYDLPEINVLSTFRDISDRSNYVLGSPATCNISTEEINPLPSCSFSPEQKKRRKREVSSIVLTSTPHKESLERVHGPLLRHLHQPRRNIYLLKCSRISRRRKCLFPIARIQCASTVVTLMTQAGSSATLTCPTRRLDVLRESYGAPITMNTEVDDTAEPLKKLTHDEVQSDQDDGSDTGLPHKKKALKSNTLAR
ncbi:hypothetical protein PR048_023825 [Dryococelus australis]|uniref:DDE-1 domain-containing protein n=1 Tax=Dryococelus australis TaxID=614101 RepID=A0ABQ9GV80_9NEOP|nr:hypothetical protein PR048_023825 [Dryococelus australis]